MKKVTSILSMCIAAVLCATMSYQAMAGIRQAPIRAITEGPNFHWFAYYDKLQFDPSGRYVLGMEVDFEGRSPRADDVIKIGMVDLQDNDKWIALGTSSAWGWQQGCMLQWRPNSASEVLWNDRENGRYVCRIMDVHTRKMRTIDHAIYSVSPNGKVAVSADFRRIQDTRPGYGYAGLADPFKDAAAPEDSGVFLVDLDTGGAKLIVSLAQITKVPYEQDPGDMAKGKHWFNHLLFAPDGKRFIFLNRWRVKTASGYSGFRTRMFTAAIDGSDIRLIDGYGRTSHFIWRDAENILAWAWHPSQGNAFYLYHDGTGKVEIVGKGMMMRNGHCTYLPGNEWILNDTYPTGANREQNVYLYHVGENRRVPLGGFHSPKAYSGEWRCDTHPRFSRDGKLVCIDSPHGGNGRQMYLIDIRAIAQRKSADFYVSPKGSNDNAGTKGEPFATLQRARDAVRELKKSESQRDIHVFVRGGTYYVPQGVAFGPADSGTDAQKITYAAYPNETPVFIGGVKLSGPKPYTDGISTARIPAGHRGRQIFADGRRMTLARTPNSGYFSLEKGVDIGGKLGFVYRAKDLEPSNWDISDATVNIWPYHDWFNATHGLAAIDKADRTIRLDTGARELREGNRYYVQNILALLDSAGECQIAHSKGSIYLKPFVSPAKSRTYVLSTAEAIISVKGRADAIVRNLHFEGLDFSISDEDIVNFRYAENCSVRFCRIENARDSGIEINDHAQNIVIYGNVIREHGLHGVALSGRAPGREDVNHHNVVENNHIHHCGRLIGHGYGVRISQSGHNRIVHNHIHHMPRYAATIKGVRYQILKERLKGVTWENRHDFLHSRKNLIAYNDIHHVNQDSQDTGAIESWGAGRDNVIDHNLIHEVGNDMFNIQSGLYLDDAVDYFTVTNNIIYGVAGTSGNQCIYAKGIGNRIENNILIVDRTNTSAIRSFFMADERCDHHEYVRNIIYFQNRDDAPKGAFGSGVSNIHTRGNSLVWKINSPASAEYDVWLLYACSNIRYGLKNLDGRYGIGADAEAPTVLQNLPDTGGWGVYKWSKAASIRVSAGQHKLRLQNLKGGGMNLDAIALCDDPAWKPTGNDLNEPAAGGHLIVVQAESFLTKNDKGRRADVYDFNNYSDDRVSVSDYNIIWSGGGDISVKGSPADGSFEKWRQLQNGKFDAHSVIANPMFVDAGNRDYRLKPASPAIKLGFKAIDMSTVGLKADFPDRFEKN